MAVFKKGKTPNTQQEYIESLDPFLRKNTGQFVNIGYDTSSNTPYYLPNTRQVQQPQGLNGGLNMNQMPQSDYQVQYQQPQLPQRPQLPTARSRNGQGKTNASQFLKQLTEPRDPQPLQTLRDGGVYYSNGAIKYQDGTERSGDPSAYAIASLQDGGMRYSDGSVRKTAPELIMNIGNSKGYYSDGTIRYVSQTELKGVVGLQQGVFGQEFPITQAYNNYNPELGYRSGYHSGIDIGVSNEQLTSPFTGRVVQRFYDDGTRWGNKSGHQGYGNSVTIQLDTGELLRFSHLSNSDLREGDLVEQGTLLGITGSTGNSTGDHLDLEYYDANGRLADPNSFSLLQMGSIESGKIVNEQELTPEERQNVEAIKPYFQNSSKINDPYRRQQGRVLGDQAQQQPNYPQIKVGGDFSDTIASTGQRIGVPELGVSEGVNRLGQIASNAVYQGTQGAEQLGRNAGAPELLFGEVGRGQADTGTSEILQGQLAKGLDKASNYVSQVGQKNSLGEYGASEGLQKASQIAQGAVNNAGKAYNGFVLGATDVVRNANPFGPKEAYASTTDFSTNVPIASKVNKNLVEGRILSALDGIKSTFSIKNNIEPKEMAQNVFNAGQSLMTSAVDAGQQGIQSVADQAGKAKNVIVDTFDGESEGDNDNLVEKAISSVASVFKKPSTSSSSSSKSSSNSNKSPSSSNKSSSSSNSSPIVLKQTSASSKSDAATKAISQGKLLMSSSTNPKAVNYQPTTSKPASTPKPATTSAFKKVTNKVKNIFSSIFKK